MSETLVCPLCRRPLRFDASGHRECCSVPGGSLTTEGVVQYDPSIVDDGNPEIAARDRQAHGYLAHGKFPIQIHRIEQFVQRAAMERRPGPVLDLGCGPGPTTGILLRHGFDVVAVDFSMQSLRINLERTGGAGRPALFVHADLNRIEFAPAAAAGLMMADFLQHLGDAQMQRRFLDKAFEALAPGGWFFLSFFNTNIKNRLRRDVTGAFADGAIGYRRLSYREVAAFLPASIQVRRVIPMNIFHDVARDRLASALPGAHWLARMVVIEGRKRLSPAGSELG